jgi:uncharacterized protein YaeQ
VKRLPGAALHALGRLAGRNMDLHCTIQDGQVWLSDGETTVEAGPETLLAREPARR